MLTEKRQTTKRYSKSSTDDFDSVDNSSRTKRKSKSKNIFKIIGVLFVIIVCGIAAYSSYELYKTKDPNYQNNILAQQNKDVITKVSALMELPTDEPKVAVVSDSDLLKKTQPFFQKAQDGDFILVFSEEAVIYRPSSNKIINVATVNRQPDTSAEVKSDTTANQDRKSTTTASGVGTTTISKVKN